MSNIAERLDAAESFYFKRQLESIDRTVYSTEYPHNKGRSLVPTVLDVAESAPAYTWRMTKRFGSAKITSSLGDDSPAVEVSGEESTQGIRNITDSYGYNFLEIKEAARIGAPLDAERAKAAREVIETAVDEILAVGNTANGLRGLLNQLNTGTYTLSTKAAGGTAWANAAPDEIADDITGMASALIASMSQAGGPGWEAFTAVMPVAQYTLISQRRMGDGNNSTILKHVLETSPFVKRIEPWYRCTTAGSGSVTRMAMYVNDAKVLGALVPMEFTTLSPQERGYRWVVPCIARCGGVISRYPFAMSYADSL